MPRLKIGDPQRQTLNQTLSSRHHACRWVWGLVFAAVLSACEPGGRSEHSIAANDRGVALMGQFDYEGAAETFAAVVEAEPDWLLARVNLSIATLNRQFEGDEAAALEMARQVVEEQPEQLDAHYVIALLSFNQGDCDTAARHFWIVRDGDPQDAYAAYFLAQCLVQQGDVEAAISLYQQAIDLDPYLRSAYYGAFQALQRKGDRDQATVMLERYQRLDSNPRAKLAEIKYTKMGPRAEARVARPMRAGDPRLPSGPLLAEATPMLDDAVKPSSRLSSAYANYPNGPRLLLASGSEPMLWREVEGQWQPMVDAPFAPFEVAAWGDFDNDGRTDLYLAGADGHQLWRALDGAWEAASEQLPVGPTGSADAFWLDADHDGDLDLITVSVKGELELYNNDRNGSFRPLAADYLPASQGLDVVTVAASDMDGDRDTDLILLTRQGDTEVLINDRLWQYRGDGSLGTNALQALTLADLDSDGMFEVLAVDLSGGLIRVERGNEEWVSRSTGLNLNDLGPISGLGTVDLTGDGRQELMVTGNTGWAIVDMGDQPTIVATGTEAAATYLVNDDASLSIVGIDADGQLQVRHSGAGRAAAVSLFPTGLEDTGQGMRSNASGYGSRIALRHGGTWSVAEVFRLSPGPGQSQLPLSIGLGGRAQADFVAIDWSDGVYQTELDVPTGAATVLTETQRQLASCPVLFAWDGKQYRFVSDVLGVGGIGFAIGPGQYAEPRPWEFFQLPSGLSQPRNGQYEFKLAEPMEEVAYVDQVRLHVYDLPPGWNLIMDERMGTGEPAPTGQPVFFRHSVSPTWATANGRNAVDELLHADGQAVDPGPDDPRFLGLLAREAALEFSLPEPIDFSRGQPWLRFDGWVEYGYSQTSFAAWQAGVAAKPLSLAYRSDEQAAWQTAMPGFGYPAGMPRSASVALPSMLDRARHLKLTTNQQIYLDKVAVIYAETPPAAMRYAVVDVSEAAVRRTGFASRTNLALKRPHYDYSQRATFWDTKYPQGAYTALGDALPLLRDKDNATAIIGPGDEVHMAFSADQLPDLKPGWQRELVLEFRGWAKDMDLYTLNGETVAPLPQEGEKTPAANALQKSMTTRFQAGKS